MKKNPVERIVQNYLLANNGAELKKINKKLFIEKSEKIIKNGRIDIMCFEKQLRRNKPIAIELKARDYSITRPIGQLIKYTNFVKPQNGQVYFIAPMVKEGLYEQLKPQYEGKLLKFYEYTVVPYKGFEFWEVKPKDLDDSRQVKWMDEILKQELIIQNVKRKFNLKNEKQVRNAFEIAKFFYNVKKPQYNIKQKDYMSKRAAKAGANMIRYTTNKKMPKLIATILEFYSKH